VHRRNAPIFSSDFTLFEIGVGTAVAVVVGSLVYWLLSKRFGSGQPEISGVELQFRNVFAIMDEDRRLSLIRFYMDKHGCGREEAMRHAVDHWRRDARRWD